MTFIPENPNGQATKANSSPATLASDDDAVVALEGILALLPVALSAGGGLKAGLVDAIIAGENHIGKISPPNLIQMSAEYTLPVTATPTYSAGDVVGNSITALTLLEFTDIFRVAGGSGEILAIEIATDLKSIVPRFKVLFFNASDPSIGNDNEAYKELYADTAKRIGNYTMPALETATDTANSNMSKSYYKSVNLPVKAAVGSRNLYVGLQTLDAFTQVTIQKIKVTLLMSNN